MNEIVLDLETQNPFQLSNKDVRGLKVSLVGIYHYSQNQFLSFPEEKLGELWPLLEHADRIIGYNVKGFDFPVLNNYYSGNTAHFPSLDIMEVIYQKLGFRVSLQDVARPTLNVGKSGDGLKAIQLFREGKMEELRDYCLQDVRLTKDLYEYGKKYGKLLYENKLGKGEITVDFSPSQDQKYSLNFTLPI